MGDDRRFSVMERYADAWQRGNGAAAMELWADDIVHHVPGRHRLAGTFRGKEAFLDHYGRVFAELDGTIEVVEIKELLVGKERAIALVTERAVRGDEQLAGELGEKPHPVVAHARLGRRGSLERRSGQAGLLVRGRRGVVCGRDAGLAPAG